MAWCIYSVAVVVGGDTPCLGLYHQSVRFTNYLFLIWVSWANTLGPRAPTGIERFVNWDGGL